MLARSISFTWSFFNESGLSRVYTCGYCLDYVITRILTILYWSLGQPRIPGSRSEHIKPATQKALVFIMGLNDGLIGGLYELRFSNRHTLAERLMVYEVSRVIHSYH